MSIRLLVATSTLLLLATAAIAAGPPSTPLAQTPEYKAGVAAIDAKEFEKAITIFAKMQPDNAAAPEIANWLGYANRKLKRYPESKKWYDQALLLDPNYLPALEYQGEWYIETGDIPSARANLAKLERLCGKCHEWQDLAESLTKAGVKTN